MRELQPSPAKRYSTLRAYYKQNPILAVPRRHRALAQLNAPKYCHAEPQHGALRRTYVLR
ncbi:hypothetical protein [Coleofasciculus sp. C1-SOL-03]|uniref:hypothetical protein n=1 Tax=Coleofasciculus sp. C1-SOL-03 TaxID=3069522 RepID=UPI00406307FA